MSDLDALLAAVKSNPDEDSARLVLADWLDEHGQGERAEFIRVQVELAKMTDERLALDWLDTNIAPYPLSEMTFKGKPVTEEFVDSIWRCRGLRRRERELLSLEVVFWGADLPFPALPGNGYVSWHRGFISKVRCTAADWLQHGDAILADPWTPGLDEVELTTWPWVGDVGRGHVILSASHMRECRWPDVRKWTLPPPERPTSFMGRPIVWTQEMLDDTTPAAQDAMRAMLLAYNLIPS